MILVGHAQNTSCNASIIITHQPHTLCAGNTPTFTAIAKDAGNNPIYQWKKNSMPVGTNSPNYSGPLSVGDEIVCELTTTDCTPPGRVTSNRFLFQPLELKAPEVTATADKGVVCSGTAVTFTATNKSNNTNPAFQWLVNGNAIAGANSPVFSTVILADNTVVECMMTVPQCGMSGGSTKDLSDPITIRVSSSAEPTVSITTDKPTVCTGSPVIFTATASGAGNNPVYQWQVNNTPVASVGSTFTTATLTNGDRVRVVLTPDPLSGCGAPGPVTSNLLTMEVKGRLSPSVQITASEESICSGERVTFHAEIRDGGTSPLYTWQVNGRTIGNGKPELSTNELREGDRVDLVLTTTSSCDNAPVTSNTIQMTVNPVPGITINPDTLTIWAGEQTRLNASIVGNAAAFAWTPAGLLTDGASLTPLTVPMSSSTTFRLDAVSDKGCGAGARVYVKVLRKLFIPDSFTPNGDGRNEVFRIPADTPIELQGFSVYDRWGNRVFFTKDVLEGWDGRYKGIPNMTGVYVYLIKGNYQGADVTLRGTVVLIR